MRDCLSRSNSGRRDGFASVAVLIVFGILFSSMWRASVLSSEHLTARTRGTENAVATLANARRHERRPEFDAAMRFSVGLRLAAAILVSSGAGSTVGIDLDSARAAESTKRMREEEIKAARGAGFGLVERSAFDTKYLVISDDSGFAFYVPNGKFPGLGDAGRGAEFPAVHIGTDGWDYWQDVVRGAGRGRGI